MSLLLGSLFAALATGCVSGDGAPAPGDEIVDDAGRALTPLTPVRRVVSLVPSMTELIVAMGGGDRLVARTRYDSGPELAHLPSVGGTSDPNLEVLTALAPDLVVFWADEASPVLAGRVRSLGIPVYTARIMNLAHFRRHAHNLGRLMALEAAADSLIQDMDRELREITSRIPRGPRPQVMYVVWHDPPATAGPGTFVDEIIHRAGGTNAFHDAPVAWPQVSLEVVIHRDPDVLLIPRSRHESHGTTPPFWDQPPWKELTAVRTGHVLQVPDEWFGRPGVRNLEAIELLARHLHPEMAVRTP